jgi:hypothetical protein
LRFDKFQHPPADFHVDPLHDQELWGTGHGSVIISEIPGLSVPCAAGRETKTWNKSRYRLVRMSQWNVRRRVMKLLAGQM